MSDPARSPRWLTALRAAPIVALGLHLASPALSSGHLEGVTAQTQSIAWLRAWRPGLDHDPYLPALTQFVLQTRSGVVLLLSALYRAMPGASDRAFRALVLCGLAAQFAASVSFARRLGGVSVWAASLALVLTPVVFETSFFFNDNIVAGAFAAASLALAARATTARRAAWVGVLFACGVQCRFDTALASPLVAAALWMHDDCARARARRLVAAGAAALAVNLALAVYLGFSLLDTVATVPRFLYHVEDPHRWADVRLYALGLVSLPPLALGLAHFGRALVARRAYVAAALLVAYPVALALGLSDITQARYLFSLLVPLVALFAGRGLELGRELLTSPSRPRRWAARTLAALGVAVLLAPPAGVRVLEGPRARFGRVWQVAQWRTWQRIVEENRAEVLRQVAALDDGREHVVVAVHFNDELYLRQRLIEAGFAPRPTAAVFPGCTGFAVLEKGASRVLQVRMDPQYQITRLSIPYSTALHLDAACACPAVASAPSVLLTYYGEPCSRIFPEIYGFTDAAFPAPRAHRFDDALKDPRLFESDLTARLHFWRSDVAFGYIRSLRLDADRFARVCSGASSYLAGHAERDILSGRRATIATYLAVYRATRGPTQPWLAWLRAWLLPGVR
ncbi:MAG: hypothetical protein U0324_16945 [Polyangiales bacterium]